MSSIRVMATSRGDAATVDLNRSERHYLTVDTAAGPEIIVHIGPEKLNNVASIGSLPDPTDGGTVRTYPDIVAFFKDWTNIQTDI